MEAMPCRQCVHKDVPIYTDPCKSCMDAAPGVKGLNFRLINKQTADCKTAPPSAPDILMVAKKHMDDRAATYDSPQGERSMGKTVAAFNAITGRDLSESEGFLLLQILKDVRDRQNTDTHHRDSLEDCVAYSALKAEARLLGR